jgi:starch synthase
MLLMPSVWEGLGLVALEAQAVGVSVLASRVDGLQEVIEDKKTGLLFDSEDPHAIVEAVDWALSHPREVSDMTKAARKSVESTFTLKQMVAGYERLYEELSNKN